MENYLYVFATGESSVENASDLWKKISAESKKHNCFNILGEQKISNSMSVTEAWSHHKIFTEEGITGKYLIAWVDHNPKTYEQTKFVRTVLANRDMAYGRLFSDIEDARSWLLKKIEEKEKKSSKLEE
jgi:hypothetical protein